MGQGNVVFRRIGGRVVPISTERRDRVAGVSTAAAGVGIAAAAGAHAARVTHSAAHAENAARSTVKAARAARNATENLGPLFKVKAQTEYTKAGARAFQSMAKSRALFDRAVKTQHAGTVAGAALVAAGVHRALSDTNKPRNPQREAAVATGAGVAAHFAVKSSYMRGVGNKTFQALREAAIHVAKKRGKL